MISTPLALRTLTIAPALILLPRPWMKPDDTSVLKCQPLDLGAAGEFICELMHRGDSKSVYVKGDIRSNGRTVLVVSYWHRIALADNTEC